MTARRSGSSSAARSAPAGRRPLVLLDTNALLLPFTAGVALEAEVHRWHAGAVVKVPSGVRGELDRLVARGVPHAAAARALAGRFPSVEQEGRGDLGLLVLARAHRAAVVTADRRLADRLRASGLTVLRPRDRTRLEVELPPPAPPARRRVRARATVKKRPRLAGA